VVNAALSIAVDALLWGTVAAVLLYMLLEGHVHTPWE
jgi:hypothetical protein